MKFQKTYVGKIACVINGSRKTEYPHMEDLK
jgi:hypothetical protein